VFARQALYHLSLALFDLGYFSDRDFLFVWSWPWTAIFLLMVSHMSSMTGVAQLIEWDWVSLTFVLRLALNLDPPYFCLLRSWDYRHELLCLAFLIIYLFIFAGTGVWTQVFETAKQVLTKLYCLSHTSSPFCSSYFGDGVSWTICPDWLWTSILPSLATQVARITGLSYHAWFAWFFKPSICIVNTINN
jgi:hypothetical protein